MARLDRIILRCLDPKAQAAFYCDILGMNVAEDQSVGYTGEGARISFVPAAAPYAPRPDDLYWKIALAVPDLDLACRQLHQKGISVGDARQFGDIGYLAHFTDPEGFTVELIAHVFKGKHSPLPVDPDQFGGGALLNLLTLRSGSAEAILSVCEDVGMTQLAIMPVEQFGFTLYFYAFTDERSPSADPYAVENRPWVYQRPYTVFEVQHRPSMTSVNLSGKRQAGYVGAVVAGAEREALDDVFQLKLESQQA